MPGTLKTPRTLYDKIWDDHVVLVQHLALRDHDRPNSIPTLATPKQMAPHCCILTGTHFILRARPWQSQLIALHRHLVHEVTSPQAFEGLCVAYQYRPP